MLSDILSRHRGPFLFCLTRPGVKSRLKSEWLKSEVASEDVAEEAMSLLSDPRDTVCGVGVWSQRENQFVTSITGEKDL